MGSDLMLNRSYIKDLSDAEFEANMQDTLNCLIHIVKQMWGGQRLSAEALQFMEDHKLILNHPIFWSGFTLHRFIIDLFIFGKRYVKKRPNRLSYQARFVLKPLVKTIFDDYQKGIVRMQPIQLSSIQVNKHGIRLDVEWSYIKDLSDAELEAKMQDTLNCLIHIVKQMWGEICVSAEEYCVDGYVKKRPNRLSYQARFVLKPLVKTIFDDYQKGIVRMQPIQLSSIQVDKHGIRLDVEWSYIKDLSDAEFEAKMQDTLNCLIHIVKQMWGEEFCVDGYVKKRPNRLSYQAGFVLKPLVKTIFDDYQKGIVSMQPIQLSSIQANKLGIGLDVEKMWGGQRLSAEALQFMQLCKNLDSFLGVLCGRICEEEAKSSFLPSGVCFEAYWLRPYSMITKKAYVAEFEAKMQDTLNCLIHILKQMWGGQTLFAEALQFMQLCKNLDSFLYVKKRPIRLSYQARFVLKPLVKTIFDDYQKGIVRIQPIQLSSIQVNKHGIRLDVKWSYIKDLSDAEFKAKMQDTLNCLIHIVKQMWGGQRFSAEALQFM
ncbi:hypothetical protein COLO4_30603 [Corchorus olitorius]|uniref:Uncharacterized protein n=1 Tax=Corchorus olitorius TaxID=93759 RepID=A0A1R3H7S9_9ROSI|nr:hypothetical protein COLO4_30603 [Corchorus olitorius]